MSDASQLIAQQIAAAGITPDELTPVGSASKAYVDAQDAILQTNITAATTAASNALSAHKSTGGNEHPAATTSTAGFMSSADKTKLDGVATGANNYVHPATHPPSIIAQDASNRFVTDTEKSTWNAKASAASVSTVQTNLDTHTSNTVIHVTQADRDRWDAGGGGSSGPSFGKVNDINASVANDTLTIAQGTGIAVSTNTTTKTVTITATGSSTPGPHASSHAPGGSDPIQLASTTQAGLVQLNDTTTSTSTTQAGTANAVKTAKDRADAAYTAATTPASTTVVGVTQLNNTVTSTSTTQAATANAVKTANDNGTRAGSTTQAGQVQMYDGIDSTSTTLAATANAVRLASLTGGGGSVQIGTTAAVTYYVDGTAGSDTTGTGTSGAPFKTIQFATDKLWDLCKGKLNHDCNIYVKESITYAEDVVISGFWGKGSLSIRGNWTNNSTTATVNKIDVYSCNCKTTTLSYFNITASTATAITVYASIGLAFNYILITSSATSYVGFLIAYGSAVQISNSTISNRGSAIQALVMSTVYSNNNGGSGNTTSLQCSSASTIGKGGTQPTGTTAESASSGGVIR